MSDYNDTTTPMQQFAASVDQTTDSTRDAIEAQLSELAKVVENTTHQWLNVMHPDAITATVDRNSIQDTQRKQYLLPDRVDPKFALSGKQVLVILNYILGDGQRSLGQHDLQQMTWNNTVIELRRRAGIRGNSMDFGIVNWIVQQGYAQNFANPLSQRQHDLRLQFIKNLMQREPHWHAPVAAEIRRLTVEMPEVVRAQIADWMSCKTQGDFDNAFNTFKAVFGDIPSRADRERNALGEPTGQPGQVGHLDPVGGAHDSEPF